MTTWGFKGESDWSAVQQTSERSEKRRDFGVASNRIVRGYSFRTFLWLSTIHTPRLGNDPY